MSEVLVCMDNLTQNQIYYLRDFDVIMLEDINKDIFKNASTVKTRDVARYGRQLADQIVTWLEGRGDRYVILPIGSPALQGAMYNTLNKWSDDWAYCHFFYPFVVGGIFDGFYDQNGNSIAYIRKCFMDVNDTAPSYCDSF